MLLRRLQVNINMIGSLDERIYPVNMNIKSNIIQLLTNEALDMM